MSLCLILCAGCSGKQVVSEPELIRVTPPALLMEPTPEPSCRSAMGTNGDLLRCYGEYQDALGAANADKAAIKLLTEEVK
jgi:hypothetical protein